MDSLRRIPRRTIRLARWRAIWRTRGHDSRKSGHHGRSQRHEDTFGDWQDARLGGPHSSATPAARARARAVAIHSDNFAASIIFNFALANYDARGNTAPCPEVTASSSSVRYSRRGQNKVDRSCFHEICDIG